MYYEHCSCTAVVLVSYRQVVVSCSSLCSVLFVPIRNVARCGGGIDDRNEIMLLCATCFYVGVLHTASQGGGALFGNTMAARGIEMHTKVP